MKEFQVFCCTGETQEEDLATAPIQRLKRGREKEWEAKHKFALNQKIVDEVVEAFVKEREMEAFVICLFKRISICLM